MDCLQCFAHSKRFAALRISHLVAKLQLAPNSIGQAGCGFATTFRWEIHVFLQAGTQEVLRALTVCVGR